MVQERTGEHTHTLLNVSPNFAKLNYSRCVGVSAGNTCSRVYTHIRRFIAFEHAIAPFLSGVEINHQRNTIHILDWDSQHNTVLLLDQYE